MSEVDRLSQSGLYPALPIADRKDDKGHSGKSPRQQPLDRADPQAADHSDPASPRPPKSIIDEYA
jgi:hypothetical protein